MNTGSRIAGISKKKITSLFVLVITLVPAIALAYHVNLYGVNTPYQDQWELVVDFQEIDNGNYGIVDLWAQHNEHRLLFPRAVMIGAAYATSWNTRVEMFISIFLALLCFALVANIIKSTKYLATNKWILFLLLLFVSVLLFSFGQAENWLWGWQLQWYLAILGYLVVLWSLLRENISSKWIVCAGLGATLSMYSLGNGQLAWLIGLFLLYVNNKPVKIWLLSMIAAFASYYYNLERIGSPLSVSEVLDKPLLPIKYFFTYIGHPFSDDLKGAFSIGLVGVLAFTLLSVCVYLKTKGSFKQKIRALTLPIAFSGFALVSATVTTISRTSFGIDQALSSRYISVSNFFWIGLVILLITAVNQFYKNNKDKKILFASNILLIFLSVGIVSSINSLVFFRQHAGLIRSISNCTAVNDPTKECLSLTYPDEQKARARLEFLRDKNWSGYED